MTRFAPLNREDLAEHAGLFELVEAHMGFVPNSMLTMARKPAIMNAFAGLALAVNSPGDISDELKRLISEVASKAAGCQYCVAHTSHGAHRAGIDQRKLDEIWNIERSDAFSDAEKAALGVAMRAAQVPNLVTDQDFADLKRHFSEDQIVEIVAVIALFGFLNRWNDTMATPLEAAPLAFAQEELPRDQWDAGKHQP